MVLVAWYASFILRDEATDTYSIIDHPSWPLRGILDKGHNLQCLSAAFFWLKKEQDLAWEMFLSDEDLLHGLFPISLDVSVWLRALAVFGFAGYPLYAHYHLHAPWQIYRSRLQGWRNSGEDIGENLHRHVLQCSNHTTHTGARGRG